MGKTGRINRNYSKEEKLIFVKRMLAGESVEKYCDRGD